ncbi:unnamed protein product [Linum tenue]|uniref:Uncharacterized protein n=1 Tax=Linum tenue TaxID=586396 RepID=A0AAV0LW30_9ROSI|nr:unnamed protein product [Linum tenue]
MLTRDEQRR